MSASEKLKALAANMTLRESTDAERFVQADRLLRSALPQIVAVTSAAEPFRKVHPYGFRMEDIEALDAALSDLEKALGA